MLWLDNLNEEEFVEIISNCIESSEYNEELEKLFNKVKFSIFNLKG